MKKKSLDQLSILQFVQQDYPIRENCPGGTENFVYLLDKFLTIEGHSSRVLGAQSSMLFNDPEKKRLIKTPIPENYNGSDNEFYPQFFHKLQAITEIEEMQKGQYDIVHCHATDTMRYSYFAKSPVVHTLHFPVDWFWNQQIFGNIKQNNNHFIAISEAQKQDYESKGFKVDDIIYHGLILDDFKPNYIPGDYLLFLGRISSSKSPHLALEVAMKTGQNMVIAGNMQGPEHVAYYNQKIKPYITHDVSSSIDKLAAVQAVESSQQKIIFTNHANKDQKIALLQNAKAVIFTTEIAESLSYVCIEAIACGKPVIALARGGVPEVVIHGKTGFLGNNVNELVSYLPRIKEISGEYCRHVAETKFSINTEYQRYQELYKKLLS